MSWWARGILSTLSQTRHWPSSRKRHPAGAAGALVFDGAVGWAAPPVHRRRQQIEGYRWHVLRNGHLQQERISLRSTHNHDMLSGVAPRFNSMCIAHVVVTAVQLRQAQGPAYGNLLRICCPRRARRAVACQHCAVLVGRHVAHVVHCQLGAAAAVRVPLLQPSRVTSADRLVRLNHQLVSLE